MGLGQLFALSEDYPELRANENFQHLQSRISTLENTIADRREFYNESTNINNIGIETFPDLNGKIQQVEWKAVRAEARKQVLAKINSRKSAHHVMSRPEDKNQPYIISATREEDLVTRKKLKAYSPVAAGLLIFSLRVLIFSIRVPIFI